MVRKVLFYSFVSSLIFLFSVSSAPAFAAVTLPSDLYPEGAPTITGQKPETEGGSFVTAEDATSALTVRIVNFILGFAGVVAIFFIINNAWFLIASGGSEETITQHKKGLMWAVVGLILIILSYSIIRFIISIPFQADQAPAPAAFDEGGVPTGSLEDQPGAGDTGSPFGDDMAA